MSAEVCWYPDVLDELSNLEPSVKGHLGFTLRMVQSGRSPDNNKVFVGEIKELKSKGADSEFRLVYIAYPEMIHVLLVFKKDTHEGFALPNNIRKKIMARAGVAQQKHTAFLRARKGEK